MTQAGFLATAFPRARVLGHDCHAPTSVIDLSSDSDIVEEGDGEP